MSPLALILFLLVVTCGTIAVILAVAWRSFGQARHALTWSVGAGVAGLGWGVYLIGLLRESDPLGHELASCALLVGSSALLLIGFRQRARLPLREKLLASLAAATLMPIFWGGLTLSSALLVDAPPLAFTGGCLIACVVILLRDCRRAAPADRTAAALLGLSAAFHLAATFVAVAALSPMATHSGANFRLMLMLGLPASFIANGFCCILVLAADLATEMSALAATDPLTGALNRRGLDQAVAPTIANCHRRGEPIALVVADLDRFKAINDRLGHATGDDVLRRFSDYVRREIRAGDLFARLGGEEFTIVLPGSTCESAAEVIERVRRGVPELCVEAISPLALTASFGIAAIAREDSDLAAALDRADRALYVSKMSGRDRLTVFAETTAMSASARPEPAQS